MKSAQITAALNAATEAARSAGKLMRANLHRPKKVNETTLHDIKLDLDVRCQKLITRHIAKAFPEIPVLGEEGCDETIESADARWVVDPIDGTVNYAHGIPHAAVSIALQTRTGRSFESVAGVVHDPFQDETWTATATGPARRNGRVIRVSATPKLSGAVLSLGFAKNGQSLDQLVPVFAAMIPRVQKIRLMGSAALALTYVADGRFDAYVEAGIRLWDVAAGGLIVQRAGGLFDITPIGPDYRYSLNASNGVIDKELRRVISKACPKPTSPKRSTV
jgi:myo-inositol-1(or 4)-monophosphatase